MNKNDSDEYIHHYYLLFIVQHPRGNNFKKLILDIANQKYPELRKSMQQDDKYIFINNYMFIILLQQDIALRCQVAQDDKHIFINNYMFIILWHTPSK